MARQIIKDTLSLKLPEYICQIEKYLTEYPYNINVSYVVTPQRNVTVSDIEIEKTFMGSPVDIFGRIQDYSFVLYFIHPDRKVPSEFSSPDDEKCGIVSITLEPTHSLFTKAKENGSSYKEELYKFLESDLESKKWIFHPRQHYCKKLANDKLQQQIDDLVKKRTVINTKNKLTNIHLKKANKYLTKKYHAVTQPIGEVTEVEEVSRKMANFECIICHTEWQGLEPSDSACPKCKTHLYRMLKGHVQEKT